MSMTSQPIIASTFHRLGLLTLALCGFSAPALAQEIVPLGDGSSLTVNEYLIETDAEGTRSIVVRAEPNFDPEPFGQVPSDNYARQLEPLCRNLVANSWEQLQEQEARFVRVRWDFTPTQTPENVAAGITITRFHEALFALADDRKCVPMPLGVGLDRLTLALPSGVTATLRYAEAGPTPREVSLSYVVEPVLAEISEDQLGRAALELCILHADKLLADRARYYKQLESDTVSIAFVEPTGKPGYEQVRRVVFPVDQDRCLTGLSETLTEAIRAGT